RRTTRARRRRAPARCGARTADGEHLMSELTFKPLSKRLRDALARAAAGDPAPNSDGRMEVRAAAEADAIEVLIYGNIGASWWDDESVTAKSVVEALRDADASTVDVRINSYG